MKNLKIYEVSELNAFELADTYGGNIFKKFGRWLAGFTCSCNSTGDPYYPDYVDGGWDDLAGPNKW